MRYGHHREHVRVQGIELIYSTRRDEPTFPSTQPQPPVRSVPSSTDPVNGHVWGSEELTAWDAEADQLRSTMMTTTATITPGAAEESPPVMLTDDGVATVHLREHPGGWAEYLSDALST